MNGNSINICIVGGGISGLSSAVFLKDKLKDRVNISLYEASARFGGRASTFYDESANRYFDNGHHLLAGWYSNTFDYLRLINSFDNLRFQKSLSVDFKDTSGSYYKFRCSNFLPPVNLISGLFRFNALKFADKLSVLKLIRTIKFSSINDEKLKSMNVCELFDYTKQTDNIIEYFWKPFIVSVFNADLINTSAYMFIDIIKTGFNRKNNSNLVFYKTTLKDLYVDNTINYLSSNNCEVQNNSRVTAININNNNVANISFNNSNKSFDYYIFSVPDKDLKFILKENYCKAVDEKGDFEYSPIINVYHVFDDNELTNFKLNEDFIGIYNGVFQWVFKTANDTLCTVVSDAKKYTDYDKQELIDLSKKDIFSLFPELKIKNIKYSRVIKEKNATFYPNAASILKRQNNKTKLNNLILAGDWTDTGYPSTLESAVTSGKKACDIVYQRINKF
jgi:hydroxysqualene dehydroxylase